MLAAAQLAIVLTLLTVAGLVGRSFLSALRSDPGFDPKGVLAFQASLPGSQPAAMPTMFCAPRKGCWTGLSKRFRRPIRGGLEFRHGIRAFSRPANIRRPSRTSCSARLS